MKIKLLTPLCGNRIDAKGKPAGDFAFSSGAVIDWPDVEAKRFIERGYAEEAPTSQAAQPQRR